MKPFTGRLPAKTRERRAIACDDCGLIEICGNDVARCPSCGEQTERLRTITRRECTVCGLVEPYREYDGRFIADGLCAHRSSGEAVYVQLQVPR